MESFTEKILSLKEGGKPTSDLEKIIYKIWKLIKEEDILSTFLSKIKRNVFEKEGEPWGNFLELFTYQKGSLNGLQINKLRVDASS